LEGPREMEGSTRKKRHLGTREPAPGIGEIRQRGGRDWGRFQDSNKNLRNPKRTGDLESTNAGRSGTGSD